MPTMAERFEALAERNTEALEVSSTRWGEVKTVLDDVKAAVSPASPAAKEAARKESREWWAERVEDWIEACSKSRGVKAIGWALSFYIVLRILAQVGIPVEQSWPVVARLIGGADASAITQPEDTP